MRVCAWLVNLAGSGGLALKLQGATCDGLNHAVVAELVIAHGQRAELELPGVDGQGVGVATTA